MTPAKIVLQLLRMADPGSEDFRADFAAAFHHVDILDGKEVSIEWRYPPVKPIAYLQIPLSKFGLHIAEAAAYRVSPQQEHPSSVRFEAPKDEGFQGPQVIVEQKFANDEAAMLALSRGEIEVLEDIPPWNYGQLGQIRGVVVSAYRLPTVHVLLGNYETPIIRRREFRRALCYGIDRKRLLTEVLAGGDSRPGFRVLSAPIPAGITIGDAIGYGYKQQLQPHPYEPRLAAVLNATAKAALAKKEQIKSSNEESTDEKKPASKAKVEPLILIHRENKVASTMCELIKQQLGALGIPIEVKEISLAEDIDKLHWDLRYAELLFDEPLVDAQRLFGPRGLAGRCSPSMNLALIELDQATNWNDAQQTPASSSNCLRRFAGYPTLADPQVLCHSEDLNRRREISRQLVSRCLPMAEQVPAEGALGMTLDTLQTLPRFLSLNRVLVNLFGITLLIACTTPTWAVDEKSWELTPYHVQLHVVVDSSARPGAISSERLAVELLQRIRATIYPLWSVDLITPQGVERTRIFNALAHLEDVQADATSTVTFDKQIFLTVRVSPLGIVLRGREHDLYTDRWTPVLESVVRQDRMVTQQSLELLCRVFAPLAMIHVDSDDKQHVSLIFKGSELPRQTTEELFVHTNDLFQPLLVKLSRTSGAVPEMIAEVPWTFLTAVKPEPPGWQCQVFTGTRRPFGIRRHGRVELMAIGLKTTSLVTQVRFYASHEKSQSLRGYEVFEQDPESGEYTLLGTTSLAGTIPIEQTDSPVRMLVLRSDNQLLAQVPVVPGASQLVEIPIADDMARLLVQEDLNAFKEKLIDVVARRNILMARVRKFLKEDQLEDAQKLLVELNALPGRADFAQDLKALQNLAESGGQNPYHSENARIQSKITKLLDNTSASWGVSRGT